MLLMVALVELVLCWLAWLLVFIVRHRRPSAGEPVVTAPEAKRGMLLQGVAFLLVWIYVRPALFEKSPVSLVLSMIIAPVSVVLGWLAVRHLGRQWRFQAGLNADHELVQAGPYRFLRHPIYASMLGM